MLDFPASPTNGQLFTGSNGIIYQWNSAGGLWLNYGIGQNNAIIGTTPPANPVTGQLWWSPDLGQLFIYYTDPNTSQWVAAAPSATAPGSGFILGIKTTSFLSSGTFTPDTKCVCGHAWVKGGGGGGGGLNVQPTSSYGTDGGGEGGTGHKWFTRAQVMPNVAVTIGAGGAGGLGVGGQAGGNSTFGSLATGNGGAPGTSYAGGAGGGWTGDWGETGAPGGHGFYVPAASGWNVFGGVGGGRGGPPGGALGSPTAVGGTSAAANTGAGGSGAMSIAQGPGNIGGGNGGSGFGYVVEYLGA